MDLLHANISGSRLHGSFPDETNCFRNAHCSTLDETGSNADVSFATGSDVSFCCSPRTYRDVISSTMTQSLGGGCVPFQISGKRCCSTSTIGSESTDSSPTSVRSLGIFNHCSCFMVTDLVPFSRLDRSESDQSTGTSSGESGCLCSISGPNISKNCRWIIKTNIILTV